MKIFWSILAVSSLTIAGCGAPSDAAGPSKESGPEQPRFAHLAPEPGDFEMPDGSPGRAFIDLRDGTRWLCNYSRCTSDGRFPLEQTESPSPSPVSAAPPGPEPRQSGSFGNSDREAQKRTVADIRNVGTAMFSWLTDQVGAAAAGQSQTPPIELGEYPTISHTDLGRLLVPQYLREVPEIDGWGHPYDLHLNVKNPLAQRVMLIRSPGRDGRYSATEYSVDSFDPQSFDEDIVWADGFFVRWPLR